MSKIDFMSLRPKICNLLIYFYPARLLLFHIIIIFISYLPEEEDIYAPEESKPNLFDEVYSDTEDDRLLQSFLWIHVSRNASLE